MYIYTGILDFFFFLLSFTYSSSTTFKAEKEDEAYISTAADTLDGCHVSRIAVVFILRCFM